MIPTGIRWSLLAEKTIETGWQGRVTAGHCCAMSAWDDGMAAAIIDKVKAADIHIITNAPINSMLEGRHHGYPKPRGIARVKELLEAGVNVVVVRTIFKICFILLARWIPWKWL